MAILYSQLIWFLADAFGLFSTNVGSFSFNVGQRGRIFSINVGPKSGCSQFLRFMFSGRYM